MGILTWIVLGLIAGIVAQWLMPGTIQGGFIVTICLGIVGALVGGFVTSHLLGVGVGGFNIPSILIAVGGAVLLLFSYDFLRRKNILK